MKPLTVNKMMKELEEERKSHSIYYFFHDLYYRMYNFITDLKWRIPNYFERAYYGVGHSDIWGFDIYLARIIIRGIKQLKKNIHGVPLDIGDKYKNNFKQAMSEWQSILDKIIRTFEIHLLWEDEARLPIKKERKEYKDGWKLFQKYFGNLWD